MKKSFNSFEDFANAIAYGRMAARRNTINERTERRAQLVSYNEAMEAERLAKEDARRAEEAAAEAVRRAEEEAAKAVRRAAAKAHRNEVKKYMKNVDNSALCALLF